MFKALDLTINSLSLGSGSVVGKKGKKRGQFFSPFSPRAEPGPRLTINDCNFISCFAYYYFGGERIYTKKKVYFDLSSGDLETAS